MNFGQLVLVRAKKEQKCKFCASVIPMRVSYYGLRYKSKVGVRFIIRLHVHCLNNWTVLNRESRETEKQREYRLARAGVGGRPSMNLSPEEKKERNRLAVARYRDKKGV